MITDRLRLGGTKITRNHLYHNNKEISIYFLCILAQISQAYQHLPSLLEIFQTYSSKSKHKTPIHQRWFSLSGQNFEIFKSYKTTKD